MREEQEARAKLTPLQLVELDLAQAQDALTAALTSAGDNLNDFTYSSAANLTDKISVLKKQRAVLLREKRIKDLAEQIKAQRGAGQT